MSQGTVWGSAAVSGVVGALVTYALERSPEHIVDYVKDFLFTFSPVWVGLLIALLVWAFLSVRRVTHGRDDEFTKWFGQRKDEYAFWLDARQREINQFFELKFAALADGVRHRGRELEDRLEEGISGVRGQVAEHQERLRVLEHRFPGSTGLKP